jgi:hypothetical protein
MFSLLQEGGCMVLNPYGEYVSVMQLMNLLRNKKINFTSNEVHVLLLHV